MDLDDDEFEATRKLNGASKENSVEDIDLKVLQKMRDDMYGIMQFADDLEIEKKCEAEFNALNYAIKTIADRERLHKEQEEAIERLNEDKNKPLVCGDITIVNTEDIETVLNMLQEQQEQIKYHEKQKKYDDEFKSELLDNIRCLNLDKDNLQAEIKEKDKEIHRLTSLAVKLRDEIAGLKKLLWFVLGGRAFKIDKRSFISFCNPIQIEQMENIEDHSFIFRAR